MPHWMSYKYHAEWSVTGEKKESCVIADGTDAYY